MGKKVPLAVPVLVRRVKRALKEKKELLRSNRDGTYTHIDERRNVVIADNVKIETLARKLDCIEPWEEVEGDDNCG